MRPPLINSVAKILSKASRGLVRDFGEILGLQSTTQGPLSFVQTAEKRVEESLCSLLFDAYPDSHFFLEGKGFISHEAPKDAPIWIINPLDGITNFIHGIAHFGLSIALKEQGQLLLGMIYDPLRDELFWSYRGRGAFLNQMRLRVSGRKKWSEGLLALHGGAHDLKEAHGISMLKKVLSYGIDFRSSGSFCLDLAYVATGRYDGVWAYKKSRPWDGAAAGILLIKEAGGFSSLRENELSFSSSEQLICGTETMYPFLLDLGTQIQQSEPSFS